MATHNRAAGGCRTVRRWAGARELALEWTSRNTASALCCGQPEVRQDGAVLAVSDASIAPFLTLRQRRF